MFPWTQGKTPEFSEIHELFLSALCFVGLPGRFLILFARTFQTPPSGYFDGGGHADGRQRLLCAFCMAVRCHLPSAEHHCTVMHLPRNFDPALTRQGAPHVFGGTLPGGRLWPVRRGIRLSQIPLPTPHPVIPHCLRPNPSRRYPGQRACLFSLAFNHVYLNSVQQMVSGGLAGDGLQTGFSRHGLPPQRALLDTVYPLREHLNSVQRRVSGGYCEGLFPDTVCWTRLRNTWFKDHSRSPFTCCFCKFFGFH